jgi:hypothetical protein
MAEVNLYVELRCLVDDRCHVGTQEIEGDAELRLRLDLREAEELHGEIRVWRYPARWEKPLVAVGSRSECLLSFGLNSEALATVRCCRCEHLPVTC